MMKTERKPATNEDNSMLRQHHIFVSHSSADTPAVRRLVARWRQFGFDLFADFNDPTLVRAAKEGRVDAAVTKHLLTAIRNCKIFVFVSSKKSIQSGWMPWELGLAHGAVGRVHIYRHDKAELSSLPGREYLSLYKDYEFDRTNEEVYLHKVLDEATTEAANVAQIEAARDMARRALQAFHEKRFGDVVKELTESPLVQGAETVGALRGPGFNDAEALQAMYKSAIESFSTTSGQSLLDATTLQTTSGTQNQTAQLTGKNFTSVAQPRPVPVAFDSEPHPSTSDSKDSPFPIYSPWLGHLSGRRLSVRRTRMPPNDAPRTNTKAHVGLACLASC